MCVFVTDQNIHHEFFHNTKIDRRRLENFFSLDDDNFRKVKQTDKPTNRQKQKTKTKKPNKVRSHFTNRKKTNYFKFRKFSHHIP